MTVTYALLTILVAAFGAYSIAAQIYFIRELLFIFFGNELCLGIIFACWFAGIGVGAYCGAWYGKRQKQHTAAFLNALIPLTLLPLLALPCMRLLRSALDLPLGGYASIAQITGGSFLSVCPFSFMVGAVFPLACAALSGQRSTGSAAIGWVYLWEALGSLAGGVIISLLLIPRCSPLLVFGWGTCSIFTAALLIALRCTLRKGFVVHTILLLIALTADIAALATNAFPRFDAYMTLLRWKTCATGLTLMESRDSRYHNIVLAEANDQYNIYVNGTFLNSYPDEYQAACKAHLFLSQHPDPGHVLLIGGGSAGLVREMLKHPVTSLDYVELDPDITRLLTAVLQPDDKDAFEDKRVTKFFMDGRLFVKKAVKQYDLVIVETPDPSTAMLNRFYTIDFFNEVRRILSAKGMIVTGLSATENYISSEYADYNGSLYQALTHVFPHVMVVPGDRDYFFASLRSDIFSDDPQVLMKRFDRRHITSDYFSRSLFQWLVQRDRITFTEGALARRQQHMLNTDLHPITYYYNLVIWDMLAGTKSGFHLLPRMQDTWPLGLTAFGVIILFSGCRIIISKKQNSAVRLACFWVISTTGYAGIAIVIVLIFMFQNLYGYIYEKIGIITALFMLGIAGGSLCTLTRLKTSRRAGLSALIILEIILCMCAAGLPFLLRAFAAMAYAGKEFMPSAEYMYYLCIGIIGLLAGMEFPLVCHVLISQGYDGNSVAGWVESMDHIGACLGAFLTGTVMMPLWGTQWICLTSALLKIFCIVLLFLTLKMMRR